MQAVKKASEDNHLEKSVTSPKDGAVIATVALDSDQSVLAKLKAAHAAKNSWANLSFKERARTINKIEQLFLERQEELALALHQEIGKPLTESYFSEIIGSLPLFSYWAKHTEKLL